MPWFTLQGQCPDHEPVVEVMEQHDHMPGLGQVIEQECAVESCRKRLRRVIIGGNEIRDRRYRDSPGGMEVISDLRSGRLRPR